MFENKEKLMLPTYDFHIFMCQNQRPDGHDRGCCLSKGANKYLNYMKARVREIGIPNIRVNKAGCLDQCERGVAVVIYPQGIWYQINSFEDVDRIIELHLQNGKPVDELSIK